MTRIIFRLAGAAFLAGTAAAQTGSQPLTVDTPIPAPSQAKNAGTYHVATQTWTRARATVAQLGISDNIYSNTATAGYFTSVVGPTGAVAGGQIIDSGAVPGTTNPTVFTNGGAVQEISSVTEIVIGYCDLDPVAASSGWTIDFYEDYAPCTAPVTQPVGSVALTGLPSGGCWILTVDLTAATGSGQEFDLQADGGALNPGFDGQPALDSMGISWRYTGTGQALAGPLIAGDPSSTDTGFFSTFLFTGSNTYFGEAGLCPGIGTGYETPDLFYVDDLLGTSLSNCSFLGGYLNFAPSCTASPANLYSSFFMEMSTDSFGVPPGCGICVPGCVGAITSTGSPAICEARGDAVPANNDVQLVASGLPPNQFGIFAAGRASVPAMTVNSGNGWVCIDPSSLGGLGRFVGPGQVKNSGPLGTFTLDSSAGEWSLASIPTSTGTYAAMAGITSYFQAWFRDPVGAGFNFSGSTSVTWQ